MALINLPDVVQVVGSLRGQGRCTGLKFVKARSWGRLPIYLLRHFCYRMYRLATMHNITDRRGETTAGLSRIHTHSRSHCMQYNQLKINRLCIKVGSDQINSIKWSGTGLASGRGSQHQLGFLPQLMPLTTPTTCQTGSRSLDCQKKSSSDRVAMCSRSDREVIGYWSNRGWVDQKMIV